MNNQNEEIQALLDRNKRVEGDKAWETSWFRRILIAIITYISACTFLSMTGADNERAYLPAFVPTIGYLISSISLGPIKKWWIKKKY
jgi:hypothetical protein